MWRKLRKNRRFRIFMTTVAVIGSALLQTFVIQAFIRPAGLLSGGFTGIAILIDRVTSLFGINLSTSLAMVILNIRWPGPAARVSAGGLHFSHCSRYFWPVYF